MINQTDYLSVLKLSEKKFSHIMTFQKFSRYQLMSVEFEREILFTPFWDEVYLFANYEFIDHF